MQYCINNANAYTQYTNIVNHVKVKVKQSRNSPGVANRAPGGLGSQVS